MVTSQTYVKQHIIFGRGRTGTDLPKTVFIISVATSIRHTKWLCIVAGYF